MGKSLLPKPPAPPTRLDEEPDYLFWPIRRVKRPIGVGDLRGKG